VFHRVINGLVWRLRLATRLRYLRRTFRNGEALASSFLDKTACDSVICQDGTVIRHPAGRTGLAGMLLEIWHEEVYTGKFYTPAPGDVVIDAGANVGLFSIHLARLQPKCVVYAYEPFAENYDLLSANLKAAGATCVQAFPFALGGESGMSSMMEGGGRSQDHRLTSDSTDPNRATVRTCLLDEVLNATNSHTIQLFKCDIEGSEHDLFATASSDTLSRCQRFAIEYHDNLRPGTLDLLKERLSPTHLLSIKPSNGNEGYGMLYAVAKSSSL